MKIQKANIQDHLTLTQITFDGKSHWNFSKEELENWTEDLTVTPEYILKNETYTLIEENEIIGYYSFLKLNKTEVELDHLFLYKKSIGKGFGKLLMNDFLSRLQYTEVKTVFLISEPNAENFYKKFGFVTYGFKESKIKGRFLPKMKLDL